MRRQVLLPPGEVKFEDVSAILSQFDNEDVFNSPPPAAPITFSMEDMSDVWACFDDDDFVSDTAEFLTRSNPQQNGNSIPQSLDFHST